MHRGLLAVIPLLLATTPAQAEVTAPASERFASSGVAEIASFRRHVVPLMGRLGCNGRACHGSFQGRGGFRLSLFGYDFPSDHQALTAGESPRVDQADPPESLILKKPTLALAHKGGKRFQAGTWEYRLLENWIRQGATNDSQATGRLRGLSASPAQFVFHKQGDHVQLRVIAHWSDGTEEDVTDLSRFRTNDEAVATVDVSGRVTSTGKGDTDVVAFYDNGVTPMQVMLPVSDRVGDRYPEVPAPTRIDELVIAKLRHCGITPSDLSTDTEFLRRASLDVTGTLPPPAEIESFLADASPHKRSRKIDELLAPGLRGLVGDQAVRPDREQRAVRRPDVQRRLHAAVVRMDLPACARKRRLRSTGRGARAWNQPQTRTEFRGLQPGDEHLLPQGSASRFQRTPHLAPLLGSADGSKAGRQGAGFQLCVLGSPLAVHSATSTLSTNGRNRTWSSLPPSLRRLLTGLHPGTAKRLRRCSRS